MWCRGWGWGGLWKGLEVDGDAGGGREEYGGLLPGYQVERGLAVCGHLDLSIGTQRLLPVPSQLLLCPSQKQPLNLPPRGGGLFLPVLGAC